MEQDTIYFYSRFKLYFEFSNFSLDKITIDNVEWNTNEHYFQVMKFLPDQMFKIPFGGSVDYRDYIRMASTPAMAKNLGSNRTFKIYPDWDTRRIEVMKKAVHAKFTQHEKLKALLLSTGDKKLVEDAPNDYFWGIGANKTGKNMLGIILMDTRKELILK